MERADKNMVFLNKIKDMVFVLGIGVISGYYGLTCLIFILASLTGYESVTIHLNLYHEMAIELVLTLISIPCAVYAVKECIRLKKADNRSKRL